MKKLIITTAIILGLSTGAFAECNNGGLFQRGIVPDELYYGSGYNREDGLFKPILPYHELGTNQPATAPLDSGIAVLLGLGAAYLVGKKTKEE